MSIKGNNLEGLVRVEGYPQFSNENGKQELQDQFVCKWDSWQSLIPPIGASTDQLADFILVNQNVERIGEAARISLTYKKRGLGGSGTEPEIDGDDVYQSSASVTVDDEGEVEGSTTWTRKKRKSIFQLTQNNITLNLNKRLAPPGIPDADANAWVKISREITITDDYTEITDSYIYSPFGWPSAEAATLPED